MAQRQIGRTRHAPPPPNSFIFNKPQRSRSVTNLLEREPKSQPVRLLERKLSSSSSNLNITSTNESKVKVSKLIEQFDRSKSTENIYQLTSTHCPLISHNCKSSFV